MAAPNFITHFVYSAALTTFGAALSIVGNNYIIGKDIRKVEDRLLMVETKLDFVQDDIHDLNKRQKSVEDNDMAVAMGLLKDCGKDQTKRR